MLSHGNQGEDINAGSDNPLHGNRCADTLTLRNTGTCAGYSAGTPVSQQNMAWRYLASRGTGTGVAHWLNLRTL
jgi:hypothetical protein